MVGTFICSKPPVTAEAVSNLAIVKGTAVLGRVVGNQVRTTTVGTIPDDVRRDGDGVSVTWLDPRDQRVAGGVYSNFV